MKEEERKRKCERMLGAREESVSRLLKEVERKWGGAEGFFRTVVGFGDDEIEGLRRTLITEGRGWYAAGGE